MRPTRGEVWLIDFGLAGKVRPALVVSVAFGSRNRATPYLHNGQMHDYIPDFIVRLKTADRAHLILETKGYDLLAEVKRAAAERWVAAVNADGSYGRWHYRIARKPEEVRSILTAASEGVVPAERS